MRFERARRRRQQSSPSAALALPRGMSLIRAHDRRLLGLLGLEDVCACFASRLYVIRAQIQCGLGCRFGCDRELTCVL